jgi:hypothetical protein
MTPEWQYTVTYRKFESMEVSKDFEGLQTDMDQMAIDGWEMVNACWKPGTEGTNMLAAAFWRRRVGAVKE